MFHPSLHSVRNVLCLGAHSDDIEIGCGATLLQLLDHHPQVNIHWVVLSGTGPRSAEAAASADRFLSRGTGQHHFHQWNFTDSYFPAQWSRIKDDFHALSQTVSPDLIFTHRGDDAHQDHRTVSELTWCAFRNHLVLEYEIAKYEGDLGQPNVYLPVSAENARTKCDLLLECFASQRAKPWFDADTFQAMLRLRGLESSSPSRFAEAFYCRKMALSLQSTDESMSAADVCASVAGGSAAGLAVPAGVGDATAR